MKFQNLILVFALLLPVSICYGQEQDEMIQNKEMPLPRLPKYKYQMDLVELMASTIVQPNNLKKAFDISNRQREILLERSKEFREEYKHHFEGINQTLEQISLLKVPGEPTNGKLSDQQKRTLANLEKKIDKEMTKFMPKIMSIFRTTLYPIQYRNLYSAAIYRTTWTYLEANGRVGSIFDDKFLLWPSWIAESLGYPKSLIQKLRKSGIAEQEKLQNALEEKRAKLLKDSKFKELTLTKIQKDALERLRIAVKKTRIKNRNWVIHTIVSNQNHQD